MEICRDFYLDKLIKRKNNGLIKVITGIRRCGKSYLLNNLFSGKLMIPSKRLLSQKILCSPIMMTMAS